VTKGPPAGAMAPIAAITSAVDWQVKQPPPWRRPPGMRPRKGSHYEGNRSPPVPPDVLALEDIDRPAIGEYDGLVRVPAAGISYPDAVMTRGMVLVTDACQTPLDQPTRGRLLHRRCG
jgi:hypothetical protein